MQETIEMTSWDALSVDRLVDRVCTLHANRIAVKTASGPTATYRDLDLRSRRLVNALEGLGFGKGAVVGILAKNRPEYLEVEFACARGGFLKVPFYVRNSVSEHAYFVEDSGVQVLIGEPVLLDAVMEFLETSGSAIRPVLISLDGPSEAKSYSYERLLADASSSRNMRHIMPSDPYQIRYTSGTTGRPKGAVTSHLAMSVASLGNVAHASLETTVLAGDVIAHYVPFSHASTFNIVGHSLRGVTHMPMARWDADEFLGLVEGHRISNVLLMPTQLNMLINDAPTLGKTDTSSLKTVVYGGEAMSTHILRETVDRLGPVLVQGYGSTEAPSMIVGLPQSDHVGENAKGFNGACGYPMPWVETQILDINEDPVGPGETGELCVRGPFLMDGYHGNPDATAHTLRGGWYHTGDLATMDEQGCIFLADRSSDMIISGGFNIYPAEVENALVAHPAIVEVAVFGTKDDRWGESVCAVVRFADGTGLTVDEIATYTKDNLGRYKFPKQIYVTTEAIPKSDAGKTVRRSAKELTTGMRLLS